MATPIPLWKNSVDQALASGKNVDALRAKLSNNPDNKVALKNALEYLNTKKPVQATPAPVASAPVQTPLPPQAQVEPAPVGSLSIWEMSPTNSWAQKLEQTMEQFETNAKKTAADTEASARKYGQEQSDVTVTRDADKLARAVEEEKRLAAIVARTEGNVEQRRKDAEALLQKQNEIAAMNSNIAMADAGKSGLQLSQGDLTTIQNDIMGKYASNIANAMDFKNKTNMTLDDALTRTGIEAFTKQGEINDFKNLLQDNKYAPILDAVKKAAEGDQKAIADVATFYQEMTKKKAEGEYMGVNIEEIIATKEKSFQEASAQKKENLIAEDLKEVPGANYVISQIATIINKNPGQSRTFIMGELARLAMLNTDARVALQQAIAAWAKLPAEFQKAITGQTTDAVKSNDQTTKAKIEQENILQKNNPATVVNPPKSVLSDANKTLIKNALTGNLTPERKANIIILLDKKLANKEVDQTQYDAIRKELKF